MISQGFYFRENKTHAKISEFTLPLTLNVLLGIDLILKRKSFATVLYLCFLQYGPC